jgi:hypothetical protein
MASFTVFRFGSQVHPSQVHFPPSAIAIPSKPGQQTEVHFVGFREFTEWTDRTIDMDWKKEARTYAPSI